MITLWRYLIGSYLKVFFLAIIAFIALLLISRLSEIAQFIALGTKFSIVLLFIGYQIPYILPIAASIASLLAAFTLFHRLSSSQELTTLRFSGLSLQFIATPVLLVAAFLSCGGFYLVSECATTSHLKTRQMVYDLTSVNPLLLLAHARIPKLKTAYIQMDPTHHGKSAENLLVAFFNNSTSRINCILADKIEVEDKQLIAKNIALISSSPQNNALIIENQSCMESSAMDLAQILRSKGWKIANDHLNLRLLRLRKQEYKILKQKALSPIVQKQYIKKIQKCDSELIRRSSLAIAPFTFTLLGIALGTHISRRQSRGRLILGTILAISTLISFFLAKEFDSLFYVATTLFLVPHLVIVLISWQALHRIKRGVE